MTPDVIVVGAGPAGAATAILLAEHGVSVLVLDRARVPRSGSSTGYLSPAAPRVLDRLGVLKAVDALAVPLSGMRITGPDGTRAEGAYRTIGAWNPYREHAMAIPRMVLETVLVDRLRLLPVELREEIRVTDVIVDGGRVVGIRALDGRHRELVVHAPLVVAADGRASVVAQRLGLWRPHRLQQLALLTCVAGLESCGPLGEVFVDPPDYALLNPVARDVAILALVVPLADAVPWGARLQTFMAARARQLPHLARRLAGGRIVADVQALGPLASTLLSPTVGGLLLAGDAGGVFDPLTGESVYLALSGAELAADAARRALATGHLAGQELAGYERRRRAAVAGKRRVGRALRLLVSRRRLATLAVRVLAERPALLDHLLGVIGDYVPPGALLLRRSR